MSSEWTPRDDLLTRHAARQEIMSPTGAYDQVRPGGEHPLQRLFNKGEKSMAPRENGYTPMTNGRERRTSHDQAPTTPPMSGQGAFSQGVNQGEMDCDDVADLIEVCIRKFANDPDQLNRFVVRITNLLAGVEHMSSGATDHRPSQRRTAQDAALPNRSGNSSFLRRFPDAARIKFAGHGRY